MSTTSYMAIVTGTFLVLVIVITSFTGAVSGCHPCAVLYFTMQSFQGVRLSATPQMIVLVFRCRRQKLPGSVVLRVMTHNLTSLVMAAGDVLVC